MKKYFFGSFFCLSLLIIACGGGKSSSEDTTGSTSKTESAATEQNSTAANSGASEANRKGKLIYKQYCTICHGSDGKLAISNAKDLSISVIPIEERINQITNGKGLMTPYKDILSEEQIKLVAEYLEELRQ